jgi:O-antigen/teichoic acid export membrane protein
MIKNNLKNFSYVALGRIIANASQAIFYIVFAGFVGPELYGELSYIVAIAGTFHIFAILGFPQTVVVYQSKEKEPQVNQINLLATISSVIIAIILLGFNVYASILALSVSFFVMNQHNLLGLKDYKKFFKINLFRGVLFLVLPLVFYFIFDLPGLLLGLAASHWIGSLYFIKFLKLDFQVLLKSKIDYKLIIHNFGVSASNTLPFSIDKLVIVPLMGFAMSGIYHFNLQVLIMLSVLSTSLYSFSLSEESNGTSTKKVNYLVLAITSIIVIATILFSPFVIENYFPQFLDGVYSLQILSLSLFPILFSSILNAKLQSIESITVGYSGIVRIASLIIFIIIFSETYGLVGLSFSFLLSTSVYTLFLLGLYKKNF